MEYGIKGVGRIVGYNRVKVGLCDIGVMWWI